MAKDTLKFKVRRERVPMPTYVKVGKATAVLVLLAAIYVVAAAWLNKGDIEVPYILAVSAVALAAIFGATAGLFATTKLVDDLYVDGAQVPESETWVHVLIAAVIAGGAAGMAQWFHVPLTWPF